MPLEVPSRESLHDEFIDRYQVEMPEADTSRGSDPWRLGRVVSGVAWSIISRALFVERQLLPDQSDEDFLLRWANLYDVPRLGAAAAQGANALRVTGTVGSPVPLNAELAHADGTLFKVTTNAAVVGGGGTVVVSVAATTKGAVGNKVTGEKLSFTIPPAGLQAEAELVADLSGGLDLEGKESWRARILEALAEPPEGGAVHDYVTWARVAGVKEVYVWRHRRGRGTVDVAVLQAGSGAARIIADTSAVTAAIAAARPATVPDFKVLTVVEVPKTAQVAIKIDETRFAWDFVDGGTGTLCNAANAGLKQVTVTGLTISASVGKRIQILGEQRKITARAGDVLTLDTWLPFDPVGEVVFAGGDLVAPVQAAIAALMDKLGPARGNYAALAWNDTLKVYEITIAAGEVDGVTDVDVLGPLVNTIPPDDRDDKAYLFTPTQILVVQLP